MSVQLAQQAQEILGQSARVSITERVDDVALRIGQIGKMGFGEVLESHLPRHWKPPGLRGGWTAGIWLADILTEGDHRTVSVQAYIKGMQHTRSRLSGQVIARLACREDRRGHLLKPLSKPTYGHGSEQVLPAHSMAVYDFSQDGIRCEATTVSGHHDVRDRGVLPFGHSKDDPTWPPLKVMTGSLAPLGLPLATDVLSGERADDGFDVPRIERLAVGLNPLGLLCVGDGKRRA